MNVDAREVPLRVGYLHVGRARSGVRRYGRILAQAAARRGDLEVVEADAGERDASLRDLRRAGTRLRRADVVHLQWKLADWGPRSGGLLRTDVFARTCRRPLVVTLHDVFPRHGLWERRLSPSALGLRRLASRASLVVVHFDEERRRLDGLVRPDRVTVIPHFVEEPPALPDAGSAKASLRLEGRRVMTLLGYLTKRKGHRLVMESLTRLPEDVIALFVGSVIEGRDHVLAGLRADARDLGVAERVCFAGFVPDAELPLYLAATDVALCPFSDMSASGAVSTWISAGRPIVTSDLPAFREYAALEPDALRIVEGPGPDALAARIAETLETRSSGAGVAADQAVQRLAERLATPRIVERYVEAYARALGGTHPGSRPRAARGSGG
jgi:glycosyltransferase involved in cell wall biosynthesis